MEMGEDVWRGSAIYIYTRGSKITICVSKQVLSLASDTVLQAVEIFLFTGILLELI